VKPSPFSSPPRSDLDGSASATSKTSTLGLRHRPLSPANQQVPKQPPVQPPPPPPHGVSGPDSEGLANRRCLHCAGSRRPPPFPRSGNPGARPRTTHGLTLGSGVITWRRCLGGGGGGELHIMDHLSSVVPPILRSGPGWTNSRQSRTDDRSSWTVVTSARPIVRTSRAADLGDAVGKVSAASECAYAPKASMPVQSGRLDHTHTDRQTIRGNSTV